MDSGHWHPVWEDPCTGARVVGPACDTFEAAYRAGRRPALAGPNGPEIAGPGAVVECRGRVCREALDSAQSLCTRRIRGSEGLSMEAELAAAARASLRRARAGRDRAEHRGGGIAAFVLHLDAASGEHVLSCLGRGPGQREASESSAEQPIEVARSNRGDLLGAIARSLAAEYGVPLREIA
jgi:hypothetical protein